MSSPLRICLLSAGHLASNPRLIKEADALHAAGYRVLALGCQILERVSQMDGELQTLKPWKMNNVPWHWHDRVRTAFLKRFVYPKDFSEIKDPRVVCELVAPWYRKYLRIIKEFRPDLIIAHTVPSLAIAELVRQRDSIPYGFDMEDYHPEELENEARNRMSMVVLKNYLQQARYVTGASPQISREAENVFGLKKIHTILNCFPLEPLKSSRSSERGKKMSVYWFSQTLGLDRGLDDILVACGRLKGNFEIHLRGSCSPQVRESIMQMASQNGIGDRCFIHSWCKCAEIFEKISEHDVGLALERRSPRNRDLCITNKILHYPLAGLAVVATRTLGQTWVLNECPEMGFLYSHGNIDELVRGLQRWLDHPEELKKAKEASRKYAEDRFCWEKEAPKFLEIVSNCFAQS